MLFLCLEANIKLCYNLIKDMGKPVSSKVCRVKQSTNKYRKRRGFNVNNVNNENLSSTRPASVNVNIESAIDGTPANSSSNKVKEILVNTPKDADRISGYRLVDTTILSGVLGELLCPLCQHDTLTLNDRLSKKQGLSSLLVIKCLHCQYEKEFFTSERCIRGFDINKRTAYAMRVFGHGHSGIEKFTHLMNLPKPMTKNNYDKIINKVTAVTKEIGEQTMSDAAKDLKVDPDEIVDVAVSCDGTWLKRGFQSLNGVFAALSVDSGKVLDVEAMSRICQTCCLKAELKDKDPVSYSI